MMRGHIRALRRTSVLLRYSCRVHVLLTVMMMTQTRSEYEEYVQYFEEVADNSIERKAAISRDRPWPGRELNGVNPDLIAALSNCSRWQVKCYATETSDQGLSPNGCCTSYVTDANASRICERTAASTEGGDILEISVLQGILDSTDVLSVLVRGESWPCEIESNQTILRCRVGEGVGLKQRFQVILGGIDEPIVSCHDAISYAPPVITNITGCPEAGCARAGSDMITIDGFNFGRAGSLVFLGSEACENVIHGDSTNASTCSDSDNDALSLDPICHRRILCQTPPLLSASIPGVDPVGVILVQGNQFSESEIATFSYERCPNGTYQAAENGFLGCRNCAPGYISSEEDSLACSACPPGTFAERAGLGHCALCEHGTFSGTYGSSRCETCASGYHATNRGSVECHRCDLAYRGSIDCKFPVLGVVFSISVIIIILIVLACFFRMRRRAKVVRDLQRALLQARLLDIEVLMNGWMIEWKDIKLLRLLGKGSHGEVWRGTLKDNLDVAVKKIFDADSPDCSPEIQFLQRVRHRRLVFFFGFGRTDDGTLFLCMEYCREGTLASFLYGSDNSSEKVVNEKRSSDLFAAAVASASSPIRRFWGASSLPTSPLDVSRQRSKKIASTEKRVMSSSRRVPPTSPTRRKDRRNDGTPTWSTRLRLLRDTSEAMEYLHRLGAIHRDLKSSNVMLVRDRDGHLRAKVADFGLSRIIAPERHHAIVTGEDDAASSPVTPVRMSSNAGPVTLAEIRGASAAARTIDRVSSKTTDSTVSLRSALGFDLPQSATPTHAVLSVEMTCAAGTFSYLAPELVQSLMSKRSFGDHIQMLGQASYSQAVDVYAFGMIIYECIELSEPWGLDRDRYGSVQDILRQVARGKRPRVRKKSIDSAPLGLYALMVLLWDQDSSARPSFSRIRKAIKAVSDGLKQNKATNGRSRNIRRSSSASANDDERTHRISVASERSGIELTASGLSSERSGNSLVGGASKRNSRVDASGLGEDEDADMDALLFPASGHALSALSDKPDHDWGGRRTAADEPARTGDGCRRLPPPLPKSLDTTRRKAVPPPLPWLAGASDARNDGGASVVYDTPTAPHPIAPNGIGSRSSTLSGSK